LTPKGARALPADSTNEWAIKALYKNKTVSPNLWDQAKERSRAKDKSAIELNNYINSAKAKITTMYRELELDGKPITAQLLKDMYLGNHEDEERTLYHHIRTCTY
jgi:hypothetical protein